MKITFVKQTTGQTKQQHGNLNKFFKMHIQTAHAAHNRQE